MQFKSVYSLVSFVSILALLRWLQDMASSGNSIVSSIYSVITNEIEFSNEKYKICKWRRTSPFLDFETCGRGDPMCYTYLEIDSSVASKVVGVCVNGCETMHRKYITEATLSS